MNDLYFACTDCKIIADCGYRWAYWHLLQPGAVRLRERIGVQRVLDAQEYWNPPSDRESSWLHDEVLPFIRRMLTEHGEHNLVFWEIGDRPHEWWIDWLELGRNPFPTARYLAEAANIKTWQGALAYLDSSSLAPSKPWRADDDSAKERFRQSFERHRAGARAAR
jgi:hypothetical protein